MSGGFFFEYIVVSMINLEQENAKKSTDSKSSKVQSVKKPKKK